MVGEYLRRLTVLSYEAAPDIAYRSAQAIGRQKSELPVRELLDYHVCPYSKTCLIQLAR